MTINSRSHTWKSVDYNYKLMTTCSSVKFCSGTDTWIMSVMKTFHYTQCTLTLTLKLHCKVSKADDNFFHHCDEAPLSLETILQHHIHSMFCITSAFFLIGYKYCSPYASECSISYVKKIASTLEQVRTVAITPLLTDHRKWHYLLIVIQ